MDAHQKRVHPFSLGYSTAGAIAVISVPVVDDEERAERRGPHDRVATVERGNQAMIDFGLDLGISHHQQSTNPVHRAAPAQREPVRAAAQELVIPAE